MALTTQVTDVQAGFVDGKLQVKYFNVSISAGVFPDSLNGSIQVTPKDGVTIASTPEEIENIAKAKVKNLTDDEDSTPANT